MRLILLGLALLAGDVIAQTHFVIDTERNLFSDASDLSFNQEFTQNSIFNLPFGARLPGGEIPLASYSYTVRHEPTRRRRPQNQPISSQRATKPKTQPPDNSVQDSVNTESSQTSRATSAASNQISSKNSIPEDSFLPPDPSPSPKESVSVPDGGYLPPDREPREPIPELEGGYLPPDPEPKEPTPVLDDGYLPPNPDPKEPIPFLDGGYLPPNPEPKEPVAVLDDGYLPPDSEPNDPVLVLDGGYLPPDPEPKEPVPVLDDGYLPPDPGPVLDDGYLPPDPEPKVPLPALDDGYLPPDPEPKVPLPALDDGYLPPDPEPKVPLPALDGGYLPPDPSPKKPVPPPEASYRLPQLEPEIKPVKIIRPSLNPLRGMDKFSRSKSSAIPQPKKYPKPALVQGAGVRRKVIKRPISFQTRYKPPARTRVSPQKKVQPVRDDFCTRNSQCHTRELCHHGNCIDGCDIIRNMCVGNAECITRRHIPACVCPPSYVSQTSFENNEIRYDCMFMPMTNTINSRQIRHISDISRFIRAPSAPLLPVSSFASFHRRTPVRSRPTSVRQTVFRGDRGSCDGECGPNTYCEIARDNRILCKCEEGFIPDDHTINGCKPQCSSDGDCPDEYQCRGQRCEALCGPGACGAHARCVARRHTRSCECPAGYGGNANDRCTRIQFSVREVDDLEVDLCSPNPCGDNADCVVRGDRPVCSCPVGYEGDPLTRCIRGECIDHDDCPNHLACRGLRCYDPCGGNCGSGADCVVRNHQPICSCPEGYIGDPFTSCRRITESDLCNPSPCGRNTDCRAETRSGQLRAVCSCSGNKIGDPLTGCYAECTRGSDCPSHQECRDERCRNACYKGVCGENSICDVQRNTAVCRCPEFALGDANSRCYYECTNHEDCSSSQACSREYRCIDPCDGACGTGADCRVDDHAAICSCPLGYTGDPFKSCRAFTLADLCADNPCGANAECTPGKDRSGDDRPVCTCVSGYIGNAIIGCEKGDCTTDSGCRSDEVCYNFLCQSPCVYEKGSVCGDNARCTVKNRQPVCSCARGYEGDPLSACYISDNARRSGTSFSAQRRLSGGLRLGSSGSRYY